MGATVRLIRSSTLATYCSVTSMRVPVGALRLMVNCPASVRGKKGQPQQGINAEAGYEQEQQAPHCKGRPL